MQLPSFSILPASFIVVEVWLVRIFLLLAAMSIIPLLSFFIFDFLLYIWRSVTYNIPIIGGRARGKRRPRAPSLADNPAGRRIKAIAHDLKHISDDAMSTSHDTASTASQRTVHQSTQQSDET